MRERGVAAGIRRAPAGAEEAYFIQKMNLRGSRIGATVLRGRIQQPLLVTPPLDLRGADLLCCYACAVRRAPEGR